MTYEELTLSGVEQRLNDACARGEWLDLRAGNEAQDDPQNGAGWGDERIVRAEVIRTLAIAARDDWPVHAHGVRLRGAKITGQIDFESATVAVPLWLVGCYVEQSVDLVEAKTRAIGLQGSRVAGIVADGVRIEGDLNLRDGFHASGDVRLLGAQVGGDLECNGGRVEHPKGRALNADRMRVTGSVFLGDGFHASGEVRLLGAQVGSNFDCSDGRFEHPEGRALNADRMRVTGSVFLGDGFHASGEVRLPGAQVGGNLDCSGGRFEHSDGYALNADGMRIEGDLHLRHGFHATGEVRLLGAQVGGNFECNEGRFEHPDRYALSADRMRVSGNVFLSDGFHASGEVRLLGAQIGGDLYCNDGRFERSEERALNADGVRIEDGFFFRYLVVDGHVDLTRAHVGVLADDADAWPTGEHRVLLDGFEYDVIGGTGAALDAQSRVEWLGRMPPQYFWPQPYEQLAAVLEGMGHGADARQIASSSSGRGGDRGDCRGTSAHGAGFWISQFAMGGSLGAFRCIWRSFSSCSDRSLDGAPTAME